jgi:hypothetical protein
VGYGLRRATAKTVTETGEMASRPPLRIWQSLSPKEVLFEGEARQAAQELLDTGQIQPDDLSFQGDSGERALTRVIRLTVYRLIEKAEISGGALRWGNFTVGDSVQSQVDATRFVRDLFCDGSGAVFPFTLAQALARGDKATIKAQVIQGTAGERWTTLTQQLRFRYLNNLKFAVIQGQVLPVARAPRNMMELVEQAAQWAAQDLLNRYKIGRFAPDWQFDPLISRLTTLRIIETGQLDHGCTVTSLKWNEQIKVRNAEPAPHVRNRYRRDGLNDGFRPVNPVQLRQQLLRLTPEQRATLQQQIEQDQAPHEWLDLTTAIQERYFPFIHLDLQHGHVVRLTRADQQPVHTWALVERAYREAAQELVTEFNISREEYDTMEGTWFLDALQGLAALRLITPMGASYNTLTFGSGDAVAAIQFNRDNPLLSRNPLTYQPASADDDLTVGNEALNLRNSLINMNLRAGVEAQVKLAVRRHREPRLQTPPMSPEIWEAYDGVRRIGQLCARLYQPNIHEMMESIRFGGHAPAQLAAQRVEMVPSKPNEPLMPYLKKAPPAAPRQDRREVSNPWREHRYLQADEVKPIVERWYEVISSAAPYPHCLFGALSRSVYGNFDQTQNLVTARDKYFRDHSSEVLPHLGEYPDGGGHSELAAFAHIFARPIHVYYGLFNMRAEHDEYGLMRPHGIFGAEYDAEPIVLFESQDHFHSCHLRRRGEEKKKA